MTPDQRARRLLKRFTSEAEFEQYYRFGFIEFLGARSRYYIFPTYVQAVNAAGAVKEHWCVYASGTMPNADRVLGLLLHMRSDPAHVRNKACVSKYF